MRMRNLKLICAGVLFSFHLSAQPLDLQGYRLVDLTHSFNADTVFWPAPPMQFKLEQLHFGDTPAGFFYSANRFCLPEHGGTHLDAPIHFARDRETMDRVGLERLIGPVVVIDLSSKAAADRDYRVSAADVLAFEAQHGRIEPGTRVLVHTGWSSRWPDATAYLGHATDATQLHFPSYGAEAARLLIEERQVALLGIDTASIDYGPATDFPVHRIAAAANVPGLENVTGLAALPPRGAILIALPMKIEGGSGGPTRVVALVPQGADKTAPAAAELTKLLKHFLDGASRNDVAVHDRFWAEDLVYTRSAGVRIGKAEILENTRSGPTAMPEGRTTYAAEDIRIQQYGDAAVVAFRLVGTTVRGEQAEIVHYLNTGTFMKRNGEWRAVAWQSTRVP
ncbi:MAG TPA: cyclase family protein [Steroidobacteraceae bacterium]|nr:cyclase family protein [Steroidobacteraceae bacterium]